MKTNKNCCQNFKPINDFPASHYGSTLPNCSNCIYFSSRNCHKDAYDSLENEFDFI